jgi:hypothetical protein
LAVTLKSFFLGGTKKVPKSYRPQCACIRLWTDGPRRLLSDQQIGNAFPTPQYAAPAQHERRS